MFLTQLKQKYLIWGNLSLKICVDAHTVIWNFLSNCAWIKQFMLIQWNLMLIWSQCFFSNHDRFIQIRDKWCYLASTTYLCNYNFSIMWEKIYQTTPKTWSSYDIWHIKNCFSHKYALKAEKNEFKFSKGLLHKGGKLLHRHQTALKAVGLFTSSISSST